MKKKPKSAPPVTEKAPIEPEEAPQEAPSAPVVPEAPAPFNRSLIEKEFNKNPLLKGFAKYLSPLLDYFESVETRLQAADQNFLKIGHFLDRMEPLVKLGEQIQQRQAAPQPQAQPQAGSFDLGSLLQLAPAILGGGSSGIGDEITKKIIDAGLDQMFAGTDLLKAMQKKLMTEMGVSTVMSAVEKK